MFIKFNITNAIYTLPLAALSQIWRLSILDVYNYLLGYQLKECMCNSSVFSKGLYVSLVYILYSSWIETKYIEGIRWQYVQMLQVVKLS